MQGEELDKSARPWNEAAHDRRSDLNRAAEMMESMRIGSSEAGGLLGKRRIPPQRVEATEEWGTVDTSSSQPATIARKLGQELMGLINTGRAQFNPLHHGMARQYRAAVRECMRSGATIPMLPGWKPSDEIINAHMDYLDMSQRAREKANMSCYPLNSTQAGNLIYAIMTAEIVEEGPEIGRGVRILPVVLAARKGSADETRHIIGVPAGQLRGPKSGDQGAFAYEIAEGVILDAARGASIIPMINDHHNLVAFEGSVRNSTILSGEEAEEADSIGCNVLVQAGMDNAMIPLGATYNRANEHLKGERGNQPTIAATRYERGRGRHLVEQAAALINRGTYPKDNDRRGYSMRLKRAEAKHLDEHKPNKTALMAIAMAAREESERARNMPLIRDFTRICSRGAEIATMKSASYLRQVMLYSMNVQDVIRDEWETLERKARRMVRNHIKEFERRQTTSDAVDLADPDEDDYSMDSLTASSNSSGSDSDSESSYDIGSQDSFIDSGDNSDSSDIRSQRREQLGGGSAGDRKSTKGNRTTRSRDTSSKASSNEGSRRKETTHTASHRGEALTEERQELLEKHVRTLEEHIVDPHLMTDQMRDLAYESYGISMNYKYTKTAPYIPDNEKWRRNTMEGGRIQLISTFLADRLQRWEEQKVSPIEVLGHLHRGSLLQREQLHEWEAYRDSCRIKPYKRATWERIRDENGHLYNERERDFITRVLIKIYLERYCALFHQVIDSHMVLQTILRLRMEEPGSVRGLAKLFTNVLALWRQMTEEIQRGNPITEVFKRVVLSNGGGTDVVKSGLDMWNEVQDRLRALRREHPDRSEFACLQQVLQNIYTEYKDAEAMLELQTKDKTRATHSRMKSRSLWMDNAAEAPDANSTISQQRSIIMELQRDINQAAAQETKKIASLQTTSDSRGSGSSSNRGHRQGGRNDRRSRSGQTEPRDICTICGMKHYTRSAPCRYFVNGVYNLERLAEGIATSRQPEETLNYTFERVWPNSSVNRNRTEEDREKVRRMVADRLTGTGRS